MRGSFWVLLLHTERLQPVGGISFFILPLHDHQTVVLLRALYHPTVVPSCVFPAQSVDAVQKEGKPTATPPVLPLYLREGTGTDVLATLWRFQYPEEGLFWCEEGTTVHECGVL